MALRRILYVLGSLEVGGAERHVAHVAARLKERGWEPEVFVLSPGGPLTSFLEQAGVPVHGVSLPKWLVRALKNQRLRARVGLVFTAAALLRTLWWRRPQVAHFFLPAAYIIGGLASMLAFVPVRIMSRRSLNNYQEDHPLFTRIERRLHPHMTLVCGNSRAVVDQLRDEGIEPTQLRLIYNGIDTESYTRPFDKVATRIRLSVPRDALVFVVVANLIPYKGHADLIEAFARIKTQLPTPWRLLCLGRDDGIGAELQSQAKAHGMEGNIQFLGSRTDVPDFLRLADVGVLCSHQEGFSNAVLEGMAAALPMVVTDVGGNAEAVIDGENGYVVPPRDPVRLGEALLRVANDEDRSAMGERGQRRVQECFSISACIDAYETLYREAGAACT